MWKHIKDATALGWLALVSPNFLALISELGCELGISIGEALDVLTPQELGNFVLKRIGAVGGKIFPAGQDPQQDKSLEEFFG